MVGQVLEPRARDNLGGHMYVEESDRGCQRIIRLGRVAAPLGPYPVKY